MSQASSPGRCCWPLSLIRCGGPSATRTRAAAKRALSFPFVPVRQLMVRHLASASPRARLRPVALEDVQHARGEVRPTDGEGVLGWFSEADRLRLVLCRLGKSAKLGEAHDQPGATENRGRHGHPEILVDPLGGQRCKV